VIVVLSCAECVVAVDTVLYKEDFSCVNQFMALCLRASGALLAVNCIQSSQ
jgi:hypothetical protein